MVSQEIGEKVFKFYAKLDEIVGHRPALAPTMLIDTGSPSLSMTASHAEENDAEEEETEGKNVIIIVV